VARSRLEQATESNRTALSSSGSPFALLAVDLLRAKGKNG
jgi:hypothetical protein